MQSKLIQLIIPRRRRYRCCCSICPTASQTRRILRGRYNMRLTLAKSSGFCFGVDHAVTAAYLCLSDSARKMPTYMLGAITHNESVVSDLLSKGMVLADRVDDILPQSTVLIRAHGISPDIREELISKGCDVIDCTCPYVEK